MIPWEKRENDKQKEKMAMLLASFIVKKAKSTKKKSLKTERATEEKMPPRDGSYFEDWTIDLIIF